MVEWSMSRSFLRMLVIIILASFIYTDSSNAGSRNVATSSLEPRTIFARGESKEEQWSESATTTDCVIRIAHEAVVSRAVKELMVTVSQRCLALKAYGRIEVRAIGLSPGEVNYSEGTEIGVIEGPPVGGIQSGVVRVHLCFALDTDLPKSTIEILAKSFLNSREVGRVSRKITLGADTDAPKISVNPSLPPLSKVKSGGEIKLDATASETEFGGTWQSGVRMFRITLQDSNGNLKTIREDSDETNKKAKSCLSKVRSRVLPINYRVPKNLSRFKICAVAEDYDGNRSSKCGEFHTEASDNLIKNGSFESGRDPGQFKALSSGSTVIENWTVTRSSVDYIGSYWGASNGARSIDLDGTPGHGGIKQKFPTIPGQKYRVTFDMSGNPEGEPAVKRLGIKAAGQSKEFSFSIRVKDKSSMKWESQTWSFTATGPETTIEFYSLNTGGQFFGPVIDNVVVIPLPDKQEPVSIDRPKLRPERKKNS